MFFRQTLVSTCIGILILIIGIIIIKLKINVGDITERKKCPACFGVSMCEEIDDNKISLQYSNANSFFNNLFSIKNVYFGEYNNTKIVMKKLAHTSELSNFDQEICIKPELFELCFSKSYREKTKTDFYELVKLELSKKDMNDPNDKIRLCPTTAKVNNLFSNVKIQNEKDHYKFLLSSVKINPEPLILQMLVSEKGWPTPKYFGACGRLIFEEYIGPPLSDFYEESWLRRAKIASSLLDAAYMFTFKDPDFAFYLTDISMDNIAIDDQDRAIFVDLENIIIVDKHPSREVLKQMKDWDRIHDNNVDIDCQDCFVFSPADICSHKISDHNYYAICQHIITQGIGTDVHDQGFLHSPPQDILKQYPQLIDLIIQCAKPDIPQSRIDVGIRLKTELDKIITTKK